MKISRGSNVQKFTLAIFIATRGLPLFVLSRLIAVILFNLE